MNKKESPKDYHKPFKPNRDYYTYHWEVYKVDPYGNCNFDYASGYGSGYGWPLGGRDAYSDDLYSREDCS